MVDLYESFQSLGNYETRVLLLFVTIGYMANTPAKLEVLFMGTGIDFVCAQNDTQKFERLTANRSETVNQCFWNGTSSAAMTADFDNETEETGYYDNNINNLINSSGNNEDYYVMSGSIVNLTNQSCPYYAFDHQEWDFTISERYNLVCDKQDMALYAGIFYLIGNVIGAAFSGLFADKFGRKKVLVYGAMVGFISNVVSNYCPGFREYLACRVFLGVADVAVFITAAILIMELVRKDQREVVQLFLGGMIGLCEITMGILSMIIRHYRHLHLLVGSLYFLCIMFYSFYLVESPRWLSAMKCPAKARKEVESITKYNDLTKPNMKYLLQYEDMDTSANVFDLILKPVIRYRTLILFLVWFAAIFARYTIVQNTSELSPDVRINVVLGATIDASLIVPVIFLSVKVGRQITTFSLLVMMAIVCLSMIPAILYRDGVVRLTLAVLGKMVSSSCVAVLYLYTQELLPTVLRNTGLGLCVGIGYAAPLLLPQVSVKTNDYWPEAAGAGSLCVVAAFLLVALPDTTWTELCPSVRECVKFRPGHTFSFCLPDTKLKLTNENDKCKNGTRRSIADTETLTMESCVDV